MYMYMYVQFFSTCTVQCHTETQNKLLDGLLVGKYVYDIFGTNVNSVDEAA